MNQCHEYCDLNDSTSSELELADQVYHQSRDIHWTYDSISKLIFDITSVCRDNFGTSLCSEYFHDSVGTK